MVFTGWGVGERHWGGLAEQARVKADWLLPLPAGLTLEQAMAIGTAGFTAMLARAGAGGAGRHARSAAKSWSPAPPAASAASPSRFSPRRGYRVVASSGRAELAGYLKELGAAEVVDRQQLQRGGSKAPLDSARWAGAVDTVGGDTLVNLLKAMQYPARSPPAASPAAQRSTAPYTRSSCAASGLIGINSVYLAGRGSAGGLGPAGAPTSIRACWRGCTTACR